MEKQYKKLPFMEGELLKVGKRTERMISRHFVLKESTLIAFADSKSY
jgi:hypothetical protein